MMNDHDDNEEEDASWYERMANQPFQDEEIPSHLKQDQHQTTEMMIVSEEEEEERQYYERLQQHNIQITDELFKQEDDYIWQSLLRQVNHPVPPPAPPQQREEGGGGEYPDQKKPKPSSIRTTNLPTNNSPHSLTEILLSYNPTTRQIQTTATTPSATTSTNNETTLFLLQQWLFSHLPQSSKLYHLVTSFLSHTNHWSLFRSHDICQCFLIDNCLHPCFLSFLRWNSSQNSMEIMMFQTLSLYHRDNYKVIILLMNTLFHQIWKKCQDFVSIQGISSEFERRQASVGIRFAGIDRELYEEILARHFQSSPLLSAPSSLSQQPPKTGQRIIQWNGLDFQFHEEWNEYCFVYVATGLMDSPSSIEMNPVERDLLSVNQLGIEELRESDAEIINDTWKYRSTQSIYLVRQMIGTGRCIGIRHSPSQQLVSWCLCYDDGALGMLYTIESYRRKGIAKITVKSLLRRLLLHHYHDDGNSPSPSHNYHYSSAPYCFIEINNQSSMKLFQSLGFMKTMEVVWTGIQLQRK